MNILIASSELAAVARIPSVAASHQQDRKSPILNCCRLIADGNHLSAYGTDLGTGIAAWVDCDVLEPGEAVVDASKLAEIAGKLKGDVAVTTTPVGLVVKCGRSRFTLTMQPVDDYPPELVVSEDNNICMIWLTPADVTALFAGAATAAARDDKRIYLAGVALQTDLVPNYGPRLYGVGTDAVALSFAAAKVCPPVLGNGVIIHRETAKLAVSLFGETGAELRLSENLVQFATDTVRLTAKLIGAEPTAWRSMVPPADAANTALVTRADLVAALERCAAVYNNLTGDAAKKTPSVRIRWSVGDGEDVRVSYGDLRTAPAALEAIPALAMSNETDITVDPRKLMRLLEGIEDKEPTEIDRLEGLKGGEVCLSVGDRRGDHLRISAGPDRFAVLGQMAEFSHVEDEAA